MGVYNSPEMFQDKMNEMFRRIEFIREYIDELLIITKGDWSNHLNILEPVLKKHRPNRLKRNIKKIGHTDMKYLGFWVTWTGIRPVNEKVESIVNMTPPINQKQLRSFIGLVNYCSYMWGNFSHLIQPLTALMSKKVKFKWNHVGKMRSMKLNK